MKYYGYVYKITNKINGKIYVGQKKGEKLVEHYWGSGKLIIAAINKYGKENFIREILEWCEDKDTLNEKEKYWISKFDSTNSDTGYNLTSGGNGGEMPPEVLAVISDKLKVYFSDPVNRARQSESHIGLTNGMKGMTCENCESVRLRTEKLREGLASGRIVPSRKGKLHSPETLKIMSECKMGGKNPFYGKHHSEKSKASMREKLQGRIITEEQRRSISIANSGENNGMWGKSPHNQGKMCITDGVTNKYISPEDLPLYIANGWRAGSTQHHKKRK